MLPDMVRRKKESARSEDVTSRKDAEHNPEDHIVARCATGYLVRKVYYLQRDCETLARLMRSEYDMLTLPRHLRTEEYDKAVAAYYQTLQVISDAKDARDVAARDAEDARFHAKGIDDLQRRRSELRAELRQVCRHETKSSLRAMLREVQNGIISDRWDVYDDDILWLVEELCDCELALKQLKYDAEQAQCVLRQAELACAQADTRLKQYASQLRQSMQKPFVELRQARREFIRLLATDLEIDAPNLSARTSDSGVLHLYFCSVGGNAYGEGHGHSQISISDGCEFYRRDEGQAHGTRNFVEYRRIAARQRQLNR